MSLLGSLCMHLGVRIEELEGVLSCWNASLDEVEALRSHVEYTVENMRSQCEDLAFQLERLQPTGLDTEDANGQSGAEELAAQRQELISTIHRLEWAIQAILPLQDYVEAAANLMKHSIHQAAFARFVATEWMHNAYIGSTTSSSRSGSVVAPAGLSQADPGSSGTSGSEAAETGAETIDEAQSKLRDVTSWLFMHESPKLCTSATQDTKQTKYPVHDAHNVPILGGGYKDVMSLKGDAHQGKQFHHFPSKSSLQKAGYTVGTTAPGIMMFEEDHSQTASYRNSVAAQAFREQERYLVEAGKFKEAALLGIADIQAKFPHRYDAELRQYATYIEKLELSVSSSGKKKLVVLNNKDISST